MPILNVLFTVFRLYFPEEAAKFDNTEITLYAALATVWRLIPGQLDVQSKVLGAYEEYAS